QCIYYQSLELALARKETMDLYHSFFKSNPNLSIWRIEDPREVIYDYKWSLLVDLINENCIPQFGTIPLVKTRMALNKPFQLFTPVHPINSESDGGRVTKTRSSFTTDCSEEDSAVFEDSDDVTVARSLSVATPKMPDLSIPPNMGKEHSKLTALLIERLNIRSQTRNFVDFVRSWSHSVDILPIERFHFLVEAN